MQYFVPEKEIDPLQLVRARFMNFESASFAFPKYSCNTPHLAYSLCPKIEVVLVFQEVNIF
jgi:hypothetical protein